MFLNAFFAALVWFHSAPGSALPAMAVMAMAVYFVVAFNTFAMQALLLISAILTLVMLTAYHWIAIGAGFAIFVALHPRYSLSYLLYTFRFIASYGRELAPVYILARRYSIWRDLVWDIPKRLAADPRRGLFYAYENSVLIVILLNPVSLFAAAAFFDPRISNSAPLATAAGISLSALIITFATTFRVTRFLGEPERYIEVATPWAIIAGAALIWHWSDTALLSIVCFCVVMSALQVILSYFLTREIANNTPKLDDVADAIDRHARGQDIRLASNNEQLVKLMMVHDWQFCYFIAVGEPYFGLSVKDAFRQLPFLKRPAIEHVCINARVNFVLLDRAEYEEVFADRPAELLGVQQIFASDRLRVLALDWSPEVPVSE